MRLVYSLKLLSDLLFYLSFAGIIGAIAGYNDLFSKIEDKSAEFAGVIAGNHMLFGSLMFFVPCAVLLGILANKGTLRFLALILLIPAALSAFSHGMLYFFLLLPAFAYTVYYARSLPYNIKNIDYPGTFKVYMVLSLIAVFAFFAYFAVWSWIISAVTIPYLIMFTISAVILMHMVRHDTEILTHTRFKLMCISSVTGVFLLGFILSGERAASVAQFALGALRAIYFNVIIPVFELVLHVVFTIVYHIMRLILRLFRLPTEGGEIYMPYGGFGEGEGTNIWLIILLAIVSSILLLIVVYLLKLLYEFARWIYEILTDKQSAKELVPEFERIMLGDEMLPAKRKRPRINNPVRRIYMKFLKLCKTKRVVIEPSQTTADIAQNFGNAVGEYENAFALREIYIESRYGEKIPDSAAVRKCKETYDRLKRM